MGEYQDIRRPEPPTYRGYTVYCITYIQTNSPVIIPFVHIVYILLQIV